MDRKTTRAPGSRIGAAIGVLCAFGASLGLVPPSLAMRGPAASDGPTAGRARVGWTQAVTSGAKGTRIRLEVERSGATEHPVSVHLRARDPIDQQPGPAFELTDPWIDWLPGEAGAKSVWLDLLEDGVAAPRQALEIVLESLDAEVEGEPLHVAIVEKDVLASSVQTGEEFGILGSSSINQPNTEPGPSLGGFALGGRDRGHRVLAYDIACSTFPTNCADSVFVRLFAPDDTPLGPPIEVNPARQGDESEARATFAGGDTIVTVWREVGGTGIQSIFGRLFRYDGTPLTSVVVIDQAHDELENPTVSGDGTGALTVSWRRGDELLTERFRDGGSVRRRVVTSSQLVRPLTRSTGLGESVVIWHQRGGLPAAATEPAGSSRSGATVVQSSILGRRFSPNGEPLGEPFVLIETESEDFDATLNEAGDVVVVYRDPGTGRIRGRTHPKSGVPSAVYDVTEAPGERTRPRVAANGAGNFVVSWDEDVANETEVRARLFNRRSEKLTAIAVIADRVQDRFDPEDAAVVMSDSQDVAFVYRRGPSLNGRTVPAPGPSGPCLLDGTNLCLDGGRFDVRATWAATDGAGGPAGAVALTGDTGYLWYFDPGNVEVVVKVLDGCAVNGHRWVFAGGLTDLQTQLLVTDTATGEAKRYLKPDFSRYAPLRDLEAFDCTPGDGGSIAPAADTAATGQQAAPATERGHVLAAGTAPGAERVTVHEAHRRGAAARAAAACRTSEDVLCLAGRYKVSVEWAAGAAGGAAPGRVLSDDSGMFWFFDDDNVEVFAKVLDGCAINDHYWVFAAGLTDLEVRLRVTDSITGDTQFFRSPAGELFEPVVQVALFPCS